MQWSVVALTLVSSGYAMQASKGGVGAPAAAVEHGRIERKGGLRIVRLWGTPEQRGLAHGQLLGREIADLIRAEYAYRFGGSRKGLLAAGRGMLRRLITYPDDVATEIEAIYRGVVASGAKLEMPDFGRDIDLKDLQFVNALDVFALMACSGFTVWGDMVDGGGVLTTRNFDWPVSGPHMVDSTVLLVQHPDDGRAFAGVTWPGYAGVVTGISEHGFAAFLHVGSGRSGMPEPDSMPTAIASRHVLQRAKQDGFVAMAKRTLEETSPPASYITRFVMPEVPDGKVPVAVFETDIRACVHRERGKPCIVTNHFFEHEGRPDSAGRLKAIDGCVGGFLQQEDRRVSVAEAWQALQAVDRSGGRFATLHSVVFRHDPWVFELRIGEVRDGEVVAATRSKRRFEFKREEVFPRDPREPR